MTGRANIFLKWSLSSLSLVPKLIPNPYASVFALKYCDYLSDVQIMRCLTGIKTFHDILGHI